MGKNFGFRSNFIVFLSLMLVITLVGCDEPTADIENYPNKSVDFIVPMSAGGGSDIFARTLTKTIEDNNLFDQPIVVENKPGGSGAIGWSYVAQEKVGDEYTISSTSASFFTGPAAEQSPISYKDFTHIINLVEDPRVIVVNHDSDFHSIQDIVDYAKENPGELIVGGSSGVSTDAIVFYSLLDQAGIDMNYVPFTSDGGDPLTALMGGHVDIAFRSYSQIMSQVDAGEVRALGISSEERPESISNLPTLKEQGYDVVVSTLRGIVAPPNISEEAVEYLADAFEKAAATDEWKEYLESSGAVSKVIRGEDYYEANKKCTEDMIRFMPLIEKANK